jgi:hypothetical protein
MKQTLTFVAPSCTCCSEPTPLLPRTDLGDGLAVCQTSGQLYRPTRDGYTPTQLPDVAPPTRPASNVRIDLSRSGYA